jgi:uncharacterized protein YjbI with pentapeptide repeats
MANPEHLALLRSGSAEWNRWRAEQPGGENAELPDLTAADLSGSDLRNMNLFRADLAGANLDDVDLTDADLMSANLYDAELRGVFRKTRFYNANLSRARFGFLSILDRANFSSASMAGASLNKVLAAGSSFTGADLTGAHLREADLTGVDLSRADLTGANLTGANLTRATLVETILEGAHLDNCTVYGTSVWQVRLQGATQQGLVVTPADQPQVTVDDLAVAQFLYLMLQNKAVRDVIDTITSKTVLILGRFTADRKVILDVLREKLREHNYLPILFDFEVPKSRDITETVSLLARMARFVVADLTDAKSIPQELSQIVPDLPSVPVQPLLQSSDRAYSMFEHWQRFPWVLPIVSYDRIDDLLATLVERVIAPAEQKVVESRRPGPQS